MNDGATEQEEAYFIPASSEKLNAHKKSFRITEFGPFVLLGAAVASSLGLWTLILSTVW